MLINRNNKDDGCGMQLGIENIGGKLNVIMHNCYFQTLFNDLSRITFDKVTIIQCVLIYPVLSYPNMSSTI